MSDITLGQYYNTDSKIHGLDPRTKIIGVFIYLFSLFLFNNYIGYVVSIGFFVFIIAISNVPVGFLFKGLKPVIAIIIITAAFNAVLTDGTVIWNVGLVSVTREGVYKAGFLAIRLTLLVVASSVLTLTTTPKALTDGLEKLFSPLNKIGLPMDEFAMIITIAIRFIPILSEELTKIKKAQLSRGADWEEGGFIKRMRAMIPLIIPLFVSAAKRAGDLSYALEARCWYGGIPHTKLHPLHHGRNDAVAYIIICIYITTLLFSVRLFLNI